MALYSYEAFSKSGKKVKGVIDASSVAGVKEALSRQGLFAISIVPATEGAKRGFFAQLLTRGVTVKEKILFSKQLSVLLKSGVPLLRAVELLIDQFEGYLRSIIVTIKDDVKGGSSLADALNKYPKVFDTIYVQLVRAGEASGKLELILDRLTEYLERREAITKKIRGAMQTPIIQMVVALGVVVVLLTQVVPQLQDVFAAGGKKLPWSTNLLITVSDFLTEQYVVLFMMIVGVYAGITYVIRTPRGSLLLDKIKLRLPLIKYITQTGAIVQFCYTLGILLEGGVNLAESLDIVVKIIDNRVLAASLSEARDKIIKEGKIAEYLKETNMFPSMATYLIRTGEESGELDTMLQTVAKNYESDLTELVDQLTGALGPIMTVVMGLLVGFIVMAIATPILNMSQGFLK